MSRASQKRRLEKKYPRKINRFKALSVNEASRIIFSASGEDFSDHPKAREIAIIMGVVVAYLLVMWGFAEVFGNHPPGVSDAFAYTDEV
jgi:hypothetical protein